MSIVQLRPSVHVGDSIAKFGYNPDVDASTGGDEDIVAWGGLMHWHSSVVSAANIDIVSSSTDDDGSPAGIGAQTIFIQGLDANYLLQSEYVTLDGITDVHPVNDYIRIYRVHVAASGSNGTNVGNITIDDGTNTMAYIIAGTGQSLQAAYTIPADYKAGWLLRYQVTLANKQSAFALGHLMVRDFGESWHTHDIFGLSDGKDYIRELAMPQMYEPKTDLRLMIFDASADNLPVSGSFDLYLER